MTSCDEAPAILAQAPPSFWQPICERASMDLRTLVERASHHARELEAGLIDEAARNRKQRAKAIECARLVAFLHERAPDSVIDEAAGTIRNAARLLEVVRDRGGNAMPWEAPE